MLCAIYTDAGVKTGKNGRFRPFPCKSRRFRPSPADNVHFAPSFAADACLKDLAHADFSRLPPPPSHHRPAWDYAETVVTACAAEAIAHAHAQWSHSRRKWPCRRCRTARHKPS